MSVKDNQRQSMGQCWENNEDQISNCVTFSYFAKNVFVCFFLSLFSLCKPVTSVTVLDVQGKNRNAFYFD